MVISRSLLTTFALIAGLLCAPGFASTVANSLREDMELIAGENGNAVPEKIEIRKPDNEVKIVFLGLIRFYQVFISSQDGDNCGFTLSCSHYGQEALRQYGIVEGTLMTSDRLQRCYGYGRDYYPIDPATDKAIDPVSANVLWKH